MPRLQITRLDRLRLNEVVLLSVTQFVVNCEGLLCISNLSLHRRRSFTYSLARRRVAL